MEKEFPKPLGLAVRGQCKLALCHLPLALPFPDPLRVHPPAHTSASALSLPHLLSLRNHLSLRKERRRVAPEGMTTLHPECPESRDSVNSGKQVDYTKA